MSRRFKNHISCNIDESIYCLFQSDDEDFYEILDEQKTENGSESEGGINNLQVNINLSPENDDTETSEPEEEVQPK